jgi:hypothetical protein
MKQYKITAADLNQDSPDDAYLAPDDPIHELKALSGLGGLGAAARLHEYRANQNSYGETFGQAGQEQLAQNIAAQREGVDVPTMRGVVGQATLEGLAGLGLGSVAGGREALTAQGKIDVEELRKAADKEKILQQESKEQQLQTAAVEEADYRLKSVLDDTGNAAQFTANELAAKKEEDTSADVTPSVKTAKQTPAEYIAELDANKSKPNAVKLANYLAALGITDVEKGKGFNERAIQAIKAKLGGQDVVQPIDAGTGGDGAGSPGTVNTGGGGGGAGSGSTGGAGGSGIVIIRF